ncbi:MAG: C40 family peptidase [Desulfosporosinus sp.]|nr:C40 family peptidase [Desulfosporosinus sp.]MBC2728548.1 C40 family peptidase [Desulfosporosinus sp.]
MKKLKTIKSIKWSLLLVPVISMFLFVITITAAPMTITEKMNPFEIQTIAVVAAETANKANEVEPQASPVTVASAAKSSPPTTTTAPSSTPAPAKAKATSSVKKVQPQPSRSSTPTKTAVAQPSTPTKTTTAQPSKASAIIATGKQYIGVKYVYGGTTPSGFDCSGFTQYVFAKNGINLPRVSRDQFKTGTSVSFSNLKSGDLVFFSLAKNGVVDHVGIYVGNGQFINASSSKGVTIYTLGSYWKSVYVGAKRVL